MPRSSTSSTKGRHITHPEFVLPKGDACLACRARKVRCDGATPVCASCIKHWKHEGKDVSQCTCVWSTKKGRGSLGRTGRTSSGSSSRSSRSLRETSSTDSDDAYASQTESPPPFATAPWSAEPDSHVYEPQALDLAEAYFTGITASPSPLSFSLPPASASFTDSATEAVPLELASPGTFITPEFDFAEFLASTFPYNTPVDDFSSHSSSPPPPLLEPAFTLPTPPHSPEALNLFHFDEGSPIDALDALFGTARASGWEQGSGMEIPVDMGFLFPQHLGPVQDPYWISP